jgi:hypothetical protein
MLPGFQARLPAMLGLPNRRVWLCAQPGSADLACAGLMAWCIALPHTRRSEDFTFFLTVNCFICEYYGANNDKTTMLYRVYSL